MIETIGVLCQDRNSFGFLLGLARRLGCNAELVEPASGALAKSTLMSRRQAKLAVLQLTRKRVDLIVRFTDADRNPWQEVRRHELGVFPDEVSSLLVCGVAVENVEHWMALDPAYLESTLEIGGLSALSDEERTGVIKSAVARQGAPASEATARIVERAPPETVRRWLQADESFKRFYQDCRAAALRANCDVPNELDAP